MIDFNRLLFRASSMGDIMCGTKKKWGVAQSITCQRRLIQMHREALWERRANKTNKYVEKGIKSEEDSITLYCMVKGQYLKKNVERLNNDYFTGECDLYEGPEILKAVRTIDIKSCWDWTTFPSIVDQVDDGYEYQGLTYNDLCGLQCKSHVVAHCLVNTPAEMIANEKYMLARKMGEILGGNESAAFVKGCIEIERNCIFDMRKFVADYPYFEFHSINWDHDIPAEQRVFEFEVKRNNEKINAMKYRVVDCRRWMDLKLK